MYVTRTCLSPRLSLCLDESFSSPLSLIPSPGESLGSSSLYFFERLHHALLDGEKNTEHVLGKKESRVEEGEGLSNQYGYW